MFKNFIIDNYDIIASIQGIMYIAILLSTFHKSSANKIIALEVYGWVIIMEYIYFIELVFIDVDLFLLNTFILYICGLVPVALALDNNKNRFKVICIIGLINIIMIYKLVNMGVI